MAGMLRRPPRSGELGLAVVDVLALDLFVPALRRRKREVTLRAAVGKHQLTPSAGSHANQFPGPDRNRKVHAARPMTEINHTDVTL
jgi:hypothetical protein